MTALGRRAIQRVASGDVLQGAAADCNSAGETHAWFDSRVAHHLSPRDRRDHSKLSGSFCSAARLARRKISVTSVEVITMKSE
mgnify:CR=1 FL=1